MAAWYSSRREPGTAAPILYGLRRDANLTVGDNEPYAPADSVYHTIARHIEPDGPLGAMVELCNDLIADAAGQARWAERLHSIISGVVSAQGKVPTA